MSIKTSFWNPRTRSWAVILLGLGLLIGLGMIMLPQAPTIYPKYVTESPSPTGVKAFYTLLDKNFAQVQVWKKPAQALPLSASSQLMLVVEPSSPLSNTEIKQWTNWLEAGNRLWLITQDPHGLFDLQAERSGQSGQIETLTGFAELQGTYQAAIETDLRLVPDSNDLVLLKDRHGALALSRRYGQGELMVLLAPGWLTNGEILKEDHLRLVLPFITRAEPTVIWFNDYIHGSKDLPVVLGVYPDWLLALLAQVSLGFLLWLWYKGKRFGPIRTPREWVVRFGDERIRAIAAWYGRGRFYRESLAVQIEFLRQAVQARWGIPANLQGQEFIDAVRNRMAPGQQEQWLNSWREITAALTYKLSQQTYLSLSKLLDEMQKEVEQR